LRLFFRQLRQSRLLLLVSKVFLPEGINERKLKTTLFDLVDGKNLLVRELVPRLKKLMPTITEDLVRHTVWKLVEEEYLDFTVRGKVTRRR